LRLLQNTKGDIADLIADLPTSVIAYGVTTIHVILVAIRSTLSFIAAVITEWLKARVFLFVCLRSAAIAIDRKLVAKVP
jgi:hypothetical protein